MQSAAAFSCFARLLPFRVFHRRDERGEKNDLADLPFQFLSPPLFRPHSETALLKLWPRGEEKRKCLCKHLHWVEWGRGKREGVVQMSLPIAFGGRPSKPPFSWPPPSVRGGGGWGKRERKIFSPSSPLHGDGIEGRHGPSASAAVVKRICHAAFRSFTPAEAAAAGNNLLSLLTKSMDADSPIPSSPPSLVE